MKITLITTVLNEEKSMQEFLRSISTQTHMPDEIVIVDGGSTDATASVISNLRSQISNRGIRFKFLIKKGNRSVGRNEAIERSTSDIIVCSDAGCILDKNWIKNITQPFKNTKVDVVAGYSKGVGKTVFQKCLVPYVLVMEDRIEEDNFLPATRSMAFRKSIWKKIGGFDERFSHNEDYVFSRKLRKIQAHIIFRKDAITYWIPRKNVLQAFIMFFRFAYGDAESKIIRWKVILLFVRYFIIFVMIIFFITSRVKALLLISLFLFLIYILWSISKNYRYVKNLKAFFFLPVLQFTSDIAVITGSSFGLVKSFLR